MAAPSQFRLADHTLADLDALAASNGGVRTPALRDAIHYWRRLVEEAGRTNAEEFSREDWTLLAQLNDPGPLALSAEDEDGPLTGNWGQRLAIELTGQWEGRTILPLHRAEVKACKDLARRVAKLDLTRGYAMYCALRHFWGPALQTPGDGEWWHPETWMTPTARERE